MAWYKNYAKKQASGDPLASCMFSLSPDRRSFWYCNNQTSFLSIQTFFCDSCHRSVPPGSISGRMQTADECGRSPDIRMYMATNQPHKFLIKLHITQYTNAIYKIQNRDHTIYILVGESSRMTNVESGHRSCTVDSGHRSRTVDSGHRSCTVDSEHRSCTVDSEQWTPVLYSGQWTSVLYSGQWTVNTGLVQWTVNSEHRSVQWTVDIGPVQWIMNSEHRSCTVDSEQWTPVLYSGQLTPVLYSGQWTPVLYSGQWTPVLYSGEWTPDVCTMEQCIHDTGPVQMRQDTRCSAHTTPGRCSAWLGAEK